MKRKKFVKLLIMIMLLLCISQIRCEETKAKSISYKVKTEKSQNKDEKGKVRGLVSYQYPKFEETSKEIKSINKEIKKKCDAFMKSDTADSLKEYTEIAIKENGFHDENEQYYYKTNCKVTYNKNNLLSVAMSWEWYAGGVANSGSYGFNFNIKTGKKLTYKDVISGNAKAKVLKAAKSYLQRNAPDNTTAYDEIKNRKTYEFYFKSNKVYICFESYELGMGSSSHKILVSGKYR